MSTIFFLAPSHAGAHLMAQYFETYCHCKLLDLMGAATENDGFMLSGEVADKYVDEVMNAMQGLSRICGHMFSFQTVDAQFQMYRVTMM